MAEEISSAKTVDLDIRQLFDIVGTDIQIHGTYEDPVFQGSKVGKYFKDNHYEVNIRALTEKEDWKYIIVNRKPVLFLTESGLYAYVFRRKTEFAEKFRKQVCAIIKELRMGEVIRLRKELISERARLRQECCDAIFYKSAFKYVMAGYNLRYSYSKDDTWKHYIRHCMHYVIWNYKFESEYDPRFTPRLHRIVVYPRISKAIRREIVKAHRADFHGKRSFRVKTEQGILNIFNRHGLFEVKDIMAQLSSDSEDSGDDIEKDRSGDAPHPSMLYNSDDE